MKTSNKLVCGIALLGMVFLLISANQNDVWISLFDGKTLNGWKASEHPETFTVQNGMIVVYGDRAHLFYDGTIANHSFKNFEWKVNVMTTPGSNSGLFFHTEY